MSAKIKIGGISTVVIPFRESQPWEIYAETKDSTYPWFPNCLCFIGGNWGDAPSVNDKSPRDTLIREITEELDLSKHGEKYLSPRNTEKVLPEDVDMLASLIATIKAGIRPFGDYLQKIPTEVFCKQDPARAKQKEAAGKPVTEVTGICSYNVCPLTDTTWGELLYLHSKFGRLSVESCDRPVSLDDIIRDGMKWIYAHQQAAKDFFASYARRSDYQHMPMIEGISSEKIGMPLASYDEYRKLYDIEKDPAKLKP